MMSSWVHRILIHGRRGKVNISRDKNVRQATQKEVTQVVHIYYENLSFRQHRFQKFLNVVSVSIILTVEMVPKRVIGEMVLDGGGHFIPAEGIFGVHTSLVAHDRATEDTRAHHTGKEDKNIINIVTHTTHRIILAGLGGTKGETYQVGQVQSHLQGNIKLSPLRNNTEVYCCTPMYRLITCHMASDSTSTLQAHNNELGFFLRKK